MSQLKPYVESLTPVEPPEPPPVYTDRRGGIFEVETILSKRRVGRSWQFLVKWTGYGDLENTWEPLSNVKHLPELMLAAPEVS